LASSSAKVVSPAGVSFVLPALVSAMPCCSSAATPCCLEDIALWDKRPRILQAAAVQVARGSDGC
jgi:hypothetical protein